MKQTPLIFSNPSIDFLSFSVLRGPKSMRTQIGKRLQIEAHFLSILEVIWGSLGGSFGGIFGSRRGHFLELFVKLFFGQPQERPQMTKGRPRTP